MDSTAVPSQGEEVGAPEAEAWDEEAAEAAQDPTLEASEGSDAEAESANPEAAAPPPATEGGLSRSPTTGVVSVPLEAMPAVPEENVLLRGITMVSSYVADRSRLPQLANDLPIYIMKEFRAKTLLLAGLQLAAVLIVMVLEEVAIHSQGMLHCLNDLPNMHLVCLVMAALATASIVALHWVKDAYPYNYLAAALVTVLVGCFWGSAHLAFTTWVHFHVLFIMTATFLLASGLFVLLPHERLQPWPLLLSSMLPGWFAASLLDLGAAAALRGELGVQLQASLAAIFLALTLTGALLVCYLADLLVRCNPDEYMKVVVATNTALLVVVSIPIFVVSCCLINLRQLVWKTSEEARAAEGPPPRGLSDVV